jgi:hypothetical protein
MQTGSSPDFVDTVVPQTAIVTGRVIGTLRMSEAASDCKTGCNYASSSVAPSPAQKPPRERHRTSGRLPWLSTGPGPITQVLAPRGQESRSASVRCSQKALATALAGDAGRCVIVVARPAPGGEGCLAAPALPHRCLGPRLGQGPEHRVRRAVPRRPGRECIDVAPVRTHTSSPRPAGASTMAASDGTTPLSSQAGSREPARRSNAFRGR